MDRSPEGVGFFKFRPWCYHRSNWSNWQTRRFRRNPPLLPKPRHVTAIARAARAASPRCRPRTEGDRSAMRVSTESGLKGRAIVMWGVASGALSPDYAAARKGRELSGLGDHRQARNGVGSRAGGDPTNIIHAGGAGSGLN